MEMKGDSMVQYFTNSEFDQKGLPGSGSKMSNTFLVHLNELRSRCGFPFVVTSGYRSPEYNQTVSDTGANGPHTTGKAADIAVNGEQAYIVLREALAMGVFMGLGISQKDPSHFLHLDILTKEEGYPRPMTWSY